MPRHENITASWEVLTRDEIALVKKLIWKMRQRVEAGESSAEAPYAALEELTNAVLLQVMPAQGDIPS